MNSFDVENYSGVRRLVLVNSDQWINSWKFINLKCLHIAISYQFHQTTTLSFFRCRRKNSKTFQQKLHLCYLNYFTFLCCKLKVCPTSIAYSVMPWDSYDEPSLKEINLNWHKKGSQTYLTDNRTLFSNFTDRNLRQGLFYNIININCS